MTLRKNNNTFLLFSSIFTLHIFSYLMLYEAYTVDRVIITTVFFFMLIAITIFNTNQIRDISILKNPFFYLMLYSYIQSFTSPYINTLFEIRQQQFISVSYMEMLFLILIYSKYISMIKTHLTLIIYISCITLLFIFLQSFIFCVTISDSIVKIFSNIRIYNHIQTIAIPSLALGLLLIKSKYSMFLITLLLYFNFIVLFQTEARGTLISIFVALLFLFLTSYQIEKVRKNIYTIAVIFIFSIISYYTYNHFITLSGDNVLHITSLSSSGRIPIYSIVLSHLADSAYVFNAIGYSSQDISVTYFLHPHNLFLYIFLGSGTIGLLYSISMFFFFIFKLLNTYFSTINIVKRYYIAILLATITHSLVSGVYITPLTSLLIITLLSAFHNMFFRPKIKRQNSIFTYTANIVIVLFVSIYSLFLLQENLSLKTKYTTNYTDNDKEIKKYFPGIMMFPEGIYNDQK